MTAVLKGLEEALDEEIRLEKELLQAGTLKRDALVALDVAAVDRATVREQSILPALGRAAERRMRRTVEAARLMGLRDGEVTVTRIAQRAGAPPLEERAAELRRTLRDVARVNGSNKALTEQSLEYIRGFFRILGGADGEVVYTSRGLETRPAVPRLMIDEVA